uniref:G-protein coupled receptors family 1 profile domain-containing protein n=1 Tax=Ditylenchus dipsaci TaxID=166011 RepID=A0A915EQ32_9BILA
MVVILALRATKVRNATVTLILSLTISDIWTSCIVAFSLLYNSYLPTVKGTDVNPCFSLTLEMCRTGGLITGTLHLLLISIHHYIGIVRPYSDKNQLRIIAKYLCTLAWITPLLVLLILASSFPSQGYWNCTNVKFYHSRVFRLSVSCLLITIFLLITTCYIRLLWILRQQPSLDDQQQQKPKASSGTSNSRAKLQHQLTNKEKGESSERRVARENKTVWTTILICSSFFLGWAPATIHFTITCDTCDLLKDLCFILGKSIVNPLIYSIRIPEVKKEIRLMTRMFSQCVHRVLLCRQNSGGKSSLSGALNTKQTRVLDSASEDESRPLKNSTYPSNL